MGSQDCGVSLKGIAQLPFKRPFASWSLTAALRKGLSHNGASRGTWVFLNYIDGYVYVSMSVVEWVSLCTGTSNHVRTSIRPAVCCTAVACHRLHVCSRGTAPAQCKTLAMRRCCEKMNMFSAVIAHTFVPRLSESVDSLLSHKV